MVEKDRYRYFRIEARELLEALSRGLLELERAPGDKALVAKLLRSAHTLKGAARVVHQAPIGELAHAFEDALGVHREEGSPPVGRGEVDALLRLVDDLAERVAGLRAPPAATDGAVHRGEDEAQTARVDLRELDGVLDAALEAGAQVLGLRRQVRDLDHTRELVRALSDQLARRRGDGTARRHRALVDELGRTIESARRALEVRADQAAREIEQVRGAADHLRLLPARGIFGALERATRDAARELGKDVAFQAEGAEIRVEANVLTPVREALLHAVRNSVAHGIEPPEERTRLGKPGTGLVRVEVEQRARRVVFRCRDDGRGLDASAIVAAAVRRGLISERDARTLSTDAIGALLLRGGGISTTADVTAVSGRGVGLDVVRDVAQRLGAELALRSSPGAATVLEMTVPASLTSLPALHVEVAGTVVSLPLHAVRQTVFVPARAVVRTGEQRALAHDGALVPFLPLERVLRRPGARERRRGWSAVVVESDGQRVAVGSDRIVGTGDVVVRGMPDFVEVEPTVAGAALDAEGNPRLVLDAAGLVSSARAFDRGEDEEGPVVRAPILVVDDSLTTRMLEQSILESAGYEVDVAVSAEEALAKAKARKYGVFIIDVEMPGMDGFELVRVTRADPRLAATPAILVTSRSAPEDRQRGLDAGASAYIVKSEFEQGRLLAIIEELLS